MKEFIEKLIERLEGRIKYNELCHKEFSNAKMSLTYEVQINAYKNAISIVNQLAEEYINDFCEWKKTDKRKSSPYHHALKHGNITLEFHDDFKFCPYCGKKIKVVPYQPKGE